MPTTQFDPSSKLDQQFREAISRQGVPALWGKVLAAVGMAVQKHYQRVKVEMESADVDSGDPDQLPYLVGRLDPEASLKELHKNKPDLDLENPEDHPLQVTLELIYLMNESG